MEFEQHPWVLVPLIIATVELWNLFKTHAIARVARRRKTPRSSSS